MRYAQLKCPENHYLKNYISIIVNILKTKTKEGGVRVLPAVWLAEILLALAEIQGIKDN